MTAHVWTSCLVLLATPQGSPEPPSQLEEVMANVRAQKLGTGTVDDLALPEDLLRRLSDRILRRSFEETFRIVVAAPAGGPHGAETAASGAQVAPTSNEETPAHLSVMRSILDVLAVGAVAVLTLLGYFAWKARARRKE